MDKNSIIGFVLIGLIMVGFFGYQSHEMKKQAAIQAQIDSVNLAEQIRQDSIKAAYLAEHPEDTVVLSAPAERAVYTDSLLNVAAAADSAELFTLSNDKLELTFTTKGAMPYAARIKDYKSYGGEDLYLFKDGGASLGAVVYAPGAVDTRKLTFRHIPEASDDSTLVMRLPFSNGAYIEQKYTLRANSYSVDDELSFVGMQDMIPRNVISLDLAFDAVIPRLEKGYQNETRYSKLNYYFPEEKKPEAVGSNGRNGSKSIKSSLEWVAFQQQFFSAIMRAPGHFSSGDVAVSFIPEKDDSHNLMACSAHMRTDFKPGAEKITVPLEFYFGPNHFQTLKAYDHKYEKIIPLGGWLVGWFTRFVIIPIFNWLREFGLNFGLIILLMTLFIKIVVLPFAYKSYTSSAKMQALKPWIDKLSEKYPNAASNQDEAMKKQKATMDLYQRAGVNMFGGCLPMVLQFPILWAMFRFFPASIELRQQPFLWADDLSAYDSIWNFGFRIPLLGDHLSLFALLMAVSMFFYSKIISGNQVTGDDPNAKMMKFMSVWMMPIMMFFICNNLSAGLSYYYLLSNLITMLETWIIRKWFVHPEEIEAKLKASEGKPAPKSKWQQRLEEAQKMQRQMAAQQAAGGKGGSKGRRR